MRIRQGKERPGQAWFHRRMPSWLRALDDVIGIQALSPNASEIRIIHLLPGNWCDKITCEIETIDLDAADRPSYDALSYVWGDRSEDQTIRIGIKRVPVTDNLYSALRNLRLLDDRRTLWVDQICIQQSNVREKAHQISLMRRIYRECRACQIWLGEFAEGPMLLSKAQAQLALDLINELTDPDRVRPLRGTYGGPKVEAFELFRSACTRWLSRIWTLQEVVLPPESIVNWGRLTIPWTSLAALATTGHDSDLERTVAFLEFGRFKYTLEQICRLKDSPQDLAKIPLHVFNTQRYRGATDPRDRIYGALGLFPSNPLPGVPIGDYALGTGRLFTIVTVDIVLAYGDLVPLICSGNEPRATPDLPSWALDFVPHYYSDSDARNSRWMLAIEEYDGFDANAGRPLDWDRWNAERYGPAPRLETLRVDTVTEVGQRYVEGSRAGMFDVGNICKTVRQWERMAATRWNTYPRGQEGWRGAFYRTVVGDRLGDVPNQRRPSDNDLYLLELFIRDGKSWAARFQAQLYARLCKYVFYITASGRFGCGPLTLCVGDEVRIFAGCRAPLFVRPGAPARRRKPYTLVGGGYLHGAMYGECARGIDDGWELIQLC